MIRSLFHFRKHGFKSCFPLPEHPGFIVASDRTFRHVAQEPIKALLTLEIGIMHFLGGFDD
ncbi:hypothetical protein D3C76_1823650 [compost metagenome]